MKIAFIGAGGIAGNYRNSLKKLNRPITAICDLNADRANQIAEAERAASHEGATAYTDHQKMLSTEKPDVVFTCIPPGAHTTQVIDAAQSGAAIFVAKPVAIDLETAWRTRDTISAANTINQVGYMARYSDLTEKVRQLVDGRTIAMGFGRFMCRMSAGHPWWGKFAVCGGQMLEQSTHVFDLLRHLMGDVTEVQACGIKNVSEDVTDFEECTTCNLNFENGSIGNVTSTCVASTASGFAAELIGDNLYLKLSLDYQLSGHINGESVQFDGVEAGYYRQIEHFIQAVETNDQSRVRSNYADAVKTLAVTVAANRSIQTGEIEKVET